MAKTETAETILDKIVEITGLEQEDEESAEDYKARIVRHFADKYPNTDDGNAAFDELDSDVTDWVDEATEIHMNNRGARNKKRLPELDGLAEDEAPAKSSKKGSAAKSATAKSATAKKSGTKKEGSGRGFGEKKALAATFVAPDEDAKVSKFLTAVFKAYGFTKQKDRSKGGFIVYKDEGGTEIEVGPGKQERSYLMGWRAKGQKQHNYGAASLEEHLASL